MSHGRVEYACGHLKLQCRCWPHPDRVILPERCPRCLLEQAPLATPHPAFGALMPLGAGIFDRDRERLIDEARD